MRRVIRVVDRRGRVRAERERREEEWTGSSTLLQVGRERNLVTFWKLGARIPGRGGLLNDRRCQG